MKTIAIMNVKGGVGKTMTACNMAHILADTYGQRVLLIDADPQGNATAFFDRADEPDAAGLADVLNGSINYYPDVIQQTDFGVALISADSSLFSVDLNPVETETFSTRNAIRDLTDAIADDDAYDIVLIDCPPSFTAGAISALSAVNSVIVPVKLDAFSFDGMDFLLDQLTAVHRINGRARLEGVLVTLWHNCECNRQAEALLRNDYGVHVFDTHIRRSDKADESTWCKTPICEYSRYSAVARDYRDFVAEFVRDGGLKNG